MFAVTRFAFVFLLAVAVTTDCLPVSAGDLYFPPNEGEWETVQEGWDRDKLDEALSWAGEVGSSGVVILLRGRILAERHWDTGSNDDPDQQRYSWSVVGKTEQGHLIEDVASVQKSITSTLVGMAQEKGLLRIEQPVSEYLGSGWSKATPKQEAKITLRHLLTMTSGLDDQLRFTHDAGKRWRYNTPAYAKSRDCVVAVSGLEVNEMTRQWLTEPIGMSDSKWVPRPGLIRATNAYGFASTARDLARYGLLMLANGRWKGRPILGDEKYLFSATHRSQQLKPTYGYLWWLNRPRRVASAPADTFSANGALTRRIYVVPSLELVVTRIGRAPKMNKPKDFDDELMRRIMAAKPESR